MANEIAVKESVVIQGEAIKDEAKFTQKEKREEKSQKGEEKIFLKDEKPRKLAF